MKGNLKKGLLLIFFVIWIVNCESEEVKSSYEKENNSPQNNYTKKEKPADEVDLAPRPTRSKK